MKYSLPKEFIAQYPPTRRGCTRLLVIDRSIGTITDDYYRNLPNYLKPGDLVVINRTKVIPARLTMFDLNNHVRELLLLEKHGHDKPQQFKVLIRGKFQLGDVFQSGDCELIVVKKEDSKATVQSNISWEILSSKFGKIPLPPYIKRSLNSKDQNRYQTIFAQNSGSVAAPTASINLTKSIIKKLDNQGVEIAELTLHVGLGTFEPIRVTNLSEHEMHSEYFEIPSITVAAINKACLENRRVIALGTTVARALEFAATDIFALNEKPQSIKGEANIFIFGDYKFKLVDGLLTNFHAPASTVLQLAAAFAGENLLEKAYSHALDHNYRFLSYGDSMLIL